MVMISLILFIILPIIAGIQSPKTGSIICCVECDCGDVSIAGMNIRVHNNDFETETVLINNKITISDIPEGIYTLRATMIGLERRIYSQLRVAADSATILLIHTNMY